MPFETPTAFGCTRTAQRRGFALIITIVLMAFLVLLVVSMASLNRVEIQIAKNSQQLNQAQENAMTSLKIALGELQKYAGPDQRITATADLAGDASGNRLANSAAPANTTLFQSSTNGLSPVQAGTRYWTGVWKNTATADYSQKPSDIPQNSVTLSNWLVSGNEAGTLAFTPGSSVTNLTSGMSPTTLVKINSTTDGVLLVGPKSIGSSVHPTTGESDTDRYVVAPLVDLKAPAGSIPGLTTSATIGRYAWWVGDEGVKARTNLRRSDQRLTDATEIVTAKTRNFYTSQGSGLELVNYATGNPLGSAYPSGQPVLDQVLTLNTLRLAGTGATNQNNLGTATQTLFHELTVDSKSILADSYAGGLKRNLAAVMADSATGPASTDPIFTPESATGYGVPTWGHLRAWRQNAPTAAVAAGTGATWLLPSATQAARSPVVTYANLVFSLAIGAQTAGGYPLYLKVMPVVVLWNPYNTTLAANPNAELTLQFKGSGYLDFQINGTSRRILYLASAMGAAAGSDAFVFNINVPQMSPGLSNMFNAATTTAGITDIDGNRFEGYSRAGNQMQPGVSYLTSPLLLNTGITLSSAELYSSGVTPNTATTFRLVSRLQATATPGSDTCNPNQLNVYLGKTGAYAGGLNNADVYHKIEDGAFCYPNQEGSAGSAQNINIVSGTETNLVNKNPLLQLNDEDHVFAYKLQAIFESRDNCGSARGYMGYAFVPRFLLDGNPSAQHSSRTLLDETSDSSRAYHSWKGNNYVAGISFVFADWCNAGVRINGAAPLIIGSTQKQLSGRSFNTGGDSQILDLPRADTPLLSMGQLQHAPLSLLGGYTTNAFGNSAAPIRVAPGSQYVANTVRNPISKAYQDPYYDLSWHLNRSLWDRYFMLDVDASTTQADLTSGKSLPLAVYN
jgi:Tfp pilus assembly protein PilX